MNTIPDVSIVCITFNQVGYIRDALDGFVRQETTFPYEVIVHDDASTDGTREVVEEYAARYPDLIVPILQEENQHSKGKGGIRDFALPIARGKYVAFCEGDDCWVSPRKLQRQHDVMEADPDASLCIHNALIVDYDNGLLRLTEPCNGDRVKSLDEIVVEGGGVINPTASILFRRDLLGVRVKGAPVGDHFYMMDLASKGRVHWLDEPMSVYRLMAVGSWSTINKRRSPEGVRGYHDAYVRALREMGARCGGRAADAFAERIALQEGLKVRESASVAFVNGEASLRELLSTAGSKVTLAKSLVRRFGTPGMVGVAESFHARHKAREAGTLVAGTPESLPSWALPLSDPGRTDFRP